MFEAFDLRHVILKDDKFFAKTSNSHAVAASYGSYDMAAAFSYAYSNHYQYVVNSSHTEEMIRVYNKNVYKDIDFIPVNNYELIWESGNETETGPVEDAIMAGRLLKVALLDANGCWNIHPIHMPSFHIGRNSFELFTDQDAIPNFFQLPEQLVVLEGEMKEVLRKVILENSPRNICEAFKEAGYNLFQPKFYSTFYTIRSNGEYLRATTPSEDATPQHYEMLKVFADKIIER